LPPPSNLPASRKSPQAGRDAAQNTGFLREVDEALREEELVALLRRFALPVGLILVAGLLALAGTMWWNNSRKAAAAALSERAALARDRLDRGEARAAAADFTALAKDSTDGIRAVALMNAAAIAMQQGQPDSAAKQFALIAADPSLPQPYRDLATIRELSIRYDRIKPAEVIARLKPLAVPGNPWFGSAGELLGMAYLDLGKPDLAGSLFAQIGREKSAPEAIHARMRMLAGGLGYDGGVELASDDSGAGSGADPAAKPARTTPGAPSANP